MQWSSIPAVSHLVAIGAGTGDILAQCLNIAADSVVVYEADPLLAKQLAKQFADNKTLKVHSRAVAEQAGTQAMYCFNLAQCNALAPATTELAGLYPGLKTLPQQDVTTVELAAELQAVKLNGSQNMLLLELPAQNLALLRHLAGKNLLQHFSHLVLMHSAQPLYQHAASLKELQQYLTEQGYELSQTDATDPDFPLLRFYRDIKAQQLKAAQHEIAISKQQLAELTKQLETSMQHLVAEKQRAEQEKAELAKQLDAGKQHLATEKQQAEQAKADSAKQLEHLKQQVAEQTQQAEQVKQQLTAQTQQAEQAKADSAKQLEIAKQQLAAEKQQTEQQKAELVKQLQAAQQLVTDLNANQLAQNKLLTEQDSQLKALNSDAAQLQKELKQTKDSLKQEAEGHQKHKAWVESLKAQNEQTNKELKEQQRSSQLSIKLLAKVEADAAELRSRYATLLKTEKDLRSLVGELYIKLSAASKFYSKLEQEHPELLENK